VPEKKKILVADDDESICNLIKLVLEQNDFAVTTVNDGKSACDLVSADDGFDLIILDIVMPLMFGTDAAKEIRRLTDTPIMFLTARSTDDDKVGAYASGADDYLVKPFSTVELQLRVNALFKRARKKTQRVTFFESEKTVQIGEKRIKLTDREYRLFKLLYDNKGVVIDIKTIFESVWGDKYMVSSNNTVMVFVLSLRKKIEDDYTHPKHIMTVWGRGYKYVED
jgi:two-component system OmpR family response regulator